MTDKEAIAELIAAKGTAVAAAALIGVSKQRLNNWRRDGIISPSGRPMVWFALRKVGRKLPADWLKAAA